MNSKKNKNKNKNKPSNPNPPQVLTDSVKSAKSQESDVVEKEEVRVPEIISEVPVAEVLQEDKQIEASSPKKPKRNKGKKNKDDKAETFDQTSEEIPVIEKVEGIDDVKTEDPIVSEIVKDVELSTLAPAARKKKNKNKKHLDNQQNEDKSLEIKVEATETKVETPKQEETKELQLNPDSSETDIKSNKKKNKKKKHPSDSQQSDKKDDILTCTTAFKLLTEDESKTESNKDNQTSLPRIVEKDGSQLLAPENISVSEPIKNNEGGSKNKKKNKKDKANANFPEVAESSPLSADSMIISPPQDFSSPSSSMVTSENLIPSAELNNPPIVDDSILQSEKLGDDVDVKGKPSIAKPVDKKHKGKHNEPAKKDQDMSVSDNVIEESKHVLDTTDPSVTDKNVMKEFDLDTAVHEFDSTKKKKKGQKHPKSSTTSEQEGLDMNPVEHVIEFVTRSKPCVPKSDFHQITTVAKSNIKDDSQVILNKELDKVLSTMDSTKDQKKDVHLLEAKIDEVRKIETDKTPVKETTTLMLTSSELLSNSPVEQSSTAKNIDVTKQSDVFEDVQELHDNSTKKKKKGQKHPKTHLLTDLTIDDVLPLDEPSSQISIESETYNLEKPAVDINVLNIKDISDKVADIDIPETGGKKKKGQKHPTIESASEIKTETINPVLEPTITNPSIILEESGLEKSEPVKEDKLIVDVKELKSKKKRDKSSNVLLTLEPEINIKLTDLQQIESNEPASSDTSTEDKSPTDMPPLVDIDMSKLKIVTVEKVSSETVPDLIHTPRALSQNRDDNNNTVIQELGNLDTARQGFFTLSTAPIVEGSGESPILPLHRLVSGIQITEIEAPKLKPTELEKTDLKSKVMEVNKDMEDLKLSIEKSLAELTSIEKDEEKIEKQFEITEHTKSKTPEGDLPPRDLTPLHEDHPGVPIFTSLSDILQPPICPARKDNKGKNKSKKKGKPEHTLASSESVITPTTSTQESAPSSTTQEAQKDSSKSSTETTEQSKEKTDSSKDKGKQQTIDTAILNEEDIKGTDEQNNSSFEPIENFEDALTSSVDDVNKTFEMIANDGDLIQQSQENPEINVTAPDENADKAKKDAKVNPLSQPKNLLGHPDIPVQSSRTDYKKERNKTPNTKQAKVKIKDAEDMENLKTKHSKESQTENRRKIKDKTVDETVSCVNNDEYVYKYSFRRVFLQNACQVCKKDIKQCRVPCCFCNLLFYCSQKHKDEDFPQHQALCFAVSTITHLKDQKHIYADAKDVTGHNYRLIRMQVIVSCEKVLKRKLMPWEQEALLYPRICADVHCREWRQEKLVDCDGCGQISFCVDNLAHLPKSHLRWCKSYSLYQKLVGYQQTLGRLEPRLPSRVMQPEYKIPEKINEVLASMYEEKIDMNDIQYAALTQLATAPLTTAYCYQLYCKNNIMANGISKKTFTVHVIGAELQFEADALTKWEIFLLHLRPDVDHLTVMLLAPDLNPSKLPLDLLARVKLCDNCLQNQRRVTFSFQDKKTYHQYYESSDFMQPDIVCSFNPNIQRSSMCNGKDTWIETLKSIFKLKVPFIVTSYTMTELHKDLNRIKECLAEVKVFSEPKFNNFASVRPDRNFISDDEMPLLFKNYCYMIVCG